MLKLSSLKRKQRQFGLLFSAILLGIALYAGYTHSFYKNSVLIGFGIALLLLIVSFFLPSVLKWPLLIWFYLGKILGEITSTIILGIIYFIVFTPITFLRRVFKKKEHEASGWVNRENKKIDYKKLY